MSRDAAAATVYYGLNDLFGQIMACVTNDGVYQPNEATLKHVAQQMGLNVTKGWCQDPTLSLRSTICDSLGIMYQSGWIYYDETTKATAQSFDKEYCAAMAHDVRSMEKGFILLAVLMALTFIVALASQESRIKQSVSGCWARLRGVPAAAVGGPVAAEEVPNPDEEQSLAAESGTTYGAC